MPYNQNIPLAPDFMRDSQPELLGNFAAIFDFIGQDHEQFNTANAGKHKQLTFPILAADPANANEWMLYNKTSTFSNIIQLFTKNPANLVRGFSDSSINPEGQVSWVQLPSGIVLKWVIIPQLQTFIPRVVTTVWSGYADTKPFTTQYWAMVTPLSRLNFPNFNPISVMYVTSVSNPLQVSYSILQRDAFDQPPSYLDRHLIFAIGV